MIQGNLSGYECPKCGCSEMNFCESCHEARSIGGYPLKCNCGWKGFKLQLKRKVQPPLAIPTPDEILNGNGYLL